MSPEQNNRPLSRKEREREFKRKEIVEAARIVFATRGFANATLDEIAEKAEFGKGTLYNYFSSKEELFETVLADGFDEILNIAAETCGGDRGIQESYTALAARMLVYLFTNMSMHALFMREVHKMERNSHFATMFPNLVLIVEQPLKNEIASGRLRPVPTFKVASLFITMIFSLFHSSIHPLIYDCSIGCIPSLNLPAEQIESMVNENLDVLREVFFTGLFFEHSSKQSSLDK